MPFLPPEILHEILSYSLLNVQIRPTPTALLTTCSLFRDISTRITYTDLQFTTRYQLSSFIATYSNRPVPYAPRSIEIGITSDSSNLLFSDIFALFSQCFSSPDDDVAKDESGRLSLESLQLRTNSHAFDPQIDMIYLSLCLVNPTRFTWTGPDPPHHFSIAIVPQAICPLFRALATYTNLAYLELTHLAMPPDSLPTIPSLRELHLGQVVFLKPLTIANFVLDPGMNKLERVDLVDAYKASIWGYRIRRSDIEKAATHGDDSIPLDSPNNSPTQTEKPTTAGNLDVIRKVVVCKARTECIMGGDRVEENAILL
ncbi:hypothetical protein CPB84DRAFT_1782161 [Gymnopilus junonius]|uniref:Uncharacterized protein n=1 Tax=Gymnopilus junonius TaxID=109634 RepID=A0A9P5TMR4_GYMJU|nr:hypothetical protein CPB84DRAFT_1782161 [Gymnopilus junonius]